MIYIDSHVVNLFSLNHVNPFFLQVLMCKLEVKLQNTSSFTRGQHLKLCTMWNHCNSRLGNQTSNYVSTHKWITRPLNLSSNKANLSLFKTCQIIPYNTLTTISTKWYLMTCEVVFYENANLFVCIGFFYTLKVTSKWLHIDRWSRHSTCAFEECTTTGTTDSSVWF